MLFDLRGKRRRLIQVVYACLAILMGGSLVLFGIGSDAPGGIFDGLGLTNGGGASNPQYEQAIEDAETTLETDPTNQLALYELSRNRYLLATEGIVTDEETGQTSLTSDARENLDLSFDAWDRYLETDPQPPDQSMATNLSRAGELLFSDALGRSDVRDAFEIAETTAATARIAARQDPTPAGWATVSRYEYIAGNNTQGDNAFDRVLALVDEQDSDQEDLEETLDERAQEAKRLHRQLNRFLETGQDPSGALEDPFGGLGGGGPLQQPAP